MGHEEGAPALAKPVAPGGTHPKHEARNPKQIQNLQGPKHMSPPRSVPSRVSIFRFWILNLFRISCRFCTILPWTPAWVILCIFSTQASGEQAYRWELVADRAAFRARGTARAP